MSLKSAPLVSLVKGLLKSSNMLKLGATSPSCYIFAKSWGLHSTNTLHLVWMWGIFCKIFVSPPEHSYGSKWCYGNLGKKEQLSKRNRHPLAPHHERDQTPLLETLLNIFCSNMHKINIEFSLWRLDRWFYLLLSDINIVGLIPF